MGDEIDLEDDWKTLKRDTDAAPAVTLTAGEMIERIYKAIHAYWLLEPPPSGRAPEINLTVTQKETVYHAEIAAPRLGGHGSGPSFPEAIRSLHQDLCRKIQIQVENYVKEIEKKHGEIATIQKDIDATEVKRGRYQTVLDTLSK